jgi:acyl-CoA synthetase (AMP-forming)/AMP-acid ligase II
MGLIGTLLIPLYAGHTSVLMSPLAFLLRPARWIRALSKFEATLCAAPNFAYALALRKVRDEDLAGVDLSRLRIAHNGAEPVDPVTARGFVERYRRHGLPENAFYPVYGLAEATLSVAFPDPGDPLFVDTVERAQLVRGTAAPLAEGASSRATPAASFVSVGRAVPGHVVEIRDPDGDEVLSERRLGEIVVHGPSVTPGYFNLEGPPREPRRFLRTGDLGYLADGRLYVVDRIKDLIIAEGRNVTPSDLERSLAIEGVRAGRAVSFGVPDAEGGTERVVVVAETSETHAGKLALLAERIRRVVRVEHELAPSDVVLVEPGTLPRTSSGKVMRRRTRELYLGEQLVAAGSTPRVVKLWKKAKGRVTLLVQALLSRLPG